MSEGKCMMCHKPVEAPFHLNLYVTGSEGLWVCEACRLNITHAVREMMSVAGRARLMAIREIKRTGKPEEA